MIITDRRKVPQGARVIDYVARGGAAELLNARDRAILIEGPRNTGKSRAVWTKVHMLCVKYPGLRVLVVRATRASMSETVLVTYERDVRGNYRPPEWGEAGRENRKHYDYPNKSRIVVRGLDSPDDFRSAEYDLVVVFEATQITENAYGLLLPCIGRSKNNVLPYPQIILDTNPSFESHWINQLAAKGGLRRILSRHEDNPVCDENYLAMLRSLPEPQRSIYYEGKWVSEVIGYGVFDGRGIGWLRDRAKALAAGLKRPPIVGQLFAGQKGRERAVVDLQVPDLIEQPITLGTTTEPRGTVTVYEQPNPEASYCIGADFAYGLQGGGDLRPRDLDTAVVWDNSARPRRQVAIAKGHWGSLFDRVLYSLALYYGQAFIVGERQVGLLALQRLWRDYKYPYLYYERAEDQRRRPVTEKLGHPKTYADVVLERFRVAVTDHEIEMYSTDIIDEMTRMQYVNPTEIRQQVIRPDEDLKVELLGGGSPDQVMGGMYGFWGCLERKHFDMPAKRFEFGTLGHDLGHNPPPEPDARTWNHRKR